MNLEEYVGGSRELSVRRLPCARKYIETHTQGGLIGNSISDMRLNPPVIELPVMDYRKRRIEDVARHRSLIHVKRR